MISSWNHQQDHLFEVGKEYWTYYVETTKRGNRLANYTGVMHVKLETRYESGYKVFKLIKGDRLKDGIPHNVSLYMDGYGLGYCDFYDTEEECKEAHDAKLIKLANGLATNEQATIYKKLYGPKPNKPVIEVDSIAWYNSLTDDQKKYVYWLKHYYAKI